ncbi:MAG: divergent polysaccharide deacetylase family protein [Clostridia bacterium]
MKKLLILLITLIIPLSSLPSAKINTYALKPPAYLAIVIDDFGMDRYGVEDMLNIGVPLTCAIMPNLEYSTTDSNNAHNKGHEVMLHMPMEANCYLPPNYYGPELITNYETKEGVITKINNALKSVPHASGMNIHIGSGVSEKLGIMKNVYEEAQNHHFYFLDSATTINSKCEQASALTSSNYLRRDVFLEPHGQKSYYNAKQFILQAGQIAQTDGYAIAIGHVGPEGGIMTARAITDMLTTLKDMNVQIVPLSFIDQQLTNAQLTNKHAEKLSTITSK